LPQRLIFIPNADKGFVFKRITDAYTQSFALQGVQGTCLSMRDVATNKQTSSRKPIDFREEVSVIAHYSAGAERRLFLQYLLALYSATGIFGNYDVDALLRLIEFRTCFVEVAYGHYLLGCAADACCAVDICGSAAY